MKKLLGIVLLFALLIWGSFTLYNAVVLSSRQTLVARIAPDSLGDLPLLRLSKALQIPNSNEDSAGRSNIYAFLRDAYPASHQNVRIRWQDFLSQSRLYKWEGLNERLRPLLFLFPAGVTEPALAEVPRWTYNPFLGKVTPNEVWGCGTRSGKAAALAFLEAVEQAVAAGQVPNRTIYFAWLQHDQADTISATAYISRAFQVNNVKPECVFNYASNVVDSLLLDIPQSLALVGVAERRALQLRLVASGASPEKDIADVTELWRTSPVPAPISAPAAQPFWDYIVPEMPFGRRWVFANRNSLGLGAWAGSIARNDVFLNEILNNGLEVRQLFSTAQGQTISEVNLLLQPDATAEQVRDWLAGQQRPESVQVEWLSPLSEYAPVAPVAGYGFNVLQTTFRQVFGEVVVCPAIQPEPTVARHLQSLQVPIYHCSPLRYGWQEYEESSTIDERIRVSNYQEALRFYRQLLKNTAF